MQPKILLVHSGNEPFVRLDREILSNFAEVYNFYAARKFPLGFIRYWRGVKEADLAFCWFASWNSLWVLIFAKLLQRPSILVIGGYDLANLPEASYGQQRGGLGKWISRFAMRLATVLLTNSYYSQKEAEQNAGVPSHRVKVIYHGVPDPFGSLPQGHRDCMVLTVGNVEWPNLKRKGLEPFVRAAAYLPDAQFMVVGAWVDDSIKYLRTIASQNVIFTGRVSDAELLDYYRRASVYVQASLHEGFGISVAEAMLAGCIPVVTRRGALPEVAGGCGFYCERPEPVEIAEIVRMAISDTLFPREPARARILSQFPTRVRGQALKQVIQSLWSDGHAKSQPIFMGDDFQSHDQ